MKKHFYRLVIVGGVTFLLSACSPKSKEKKPNILFILADDMGYGDPGCYGNKVIRTPVIDSLANQSMRFTDCYAGASVSSPSRYCLMTGFNTGHAQIRGNMCRKGGLVGMKGESKVRRTNIQPRDITIANVLHDNGYNTCIVNKWHMGGFDVNAGPIDHGFDEFHGWLIREPRSHNYYPEVRFEDRREYTITANLNGKKGDHNTDRSTDEAITFLKKHAAAKDGKPFFLYLAYNAPHVPLDAKSRNLYEDSGLPLPDQSYASLISQMDSCIGCVLDTLKSLGMDNNTIVVYASDNGGAKAAKLQVLNPNGKLRGWKGQLYEGGIRIPMMIRWPGKIYGGAVSDEPCYFPDFFSTFIDAAKINLENTTDGKSLLPLLEGKKKTLGPRYLYWEQFPHKEFQQALRYGKWKILRLNKDEDWQLYNLKEDMSEQHDSASYYPGIVKKMGNYANGCRTDSENWPIY